MGWFVVIVLVILVLAGWLILTYNNLVSRRNRTQEAWSQIDVELKRRHDLIPNLVETVRGYAAHERGTFDEVTQARTNAVSAGATGDPAKIGAAENVLSQSLRSLFAVAENYPELKASTNFSQLQEQLTATEDKIEFSRRYYNGNVRDFNTSLQVFPTSMIGGSFGFQPFQFFQADEGDRAVPQVSFPGAGGPPAQTPPSPTAQPPSPPPGPPAATPPTS